MAVKITADYIELLNKAVEHEIGRSVQYILQQLVDWKRGSRSALILRKMLDRFQQLNVRLFFADDWMLV